ncbi:formamidopyrimidine-DNA glycosylase [Raineyella antarctica]|uniref:Formamidopyrimidine-DNA glycosylase n=1 Tax=Raineyella antarctica TaxID=1577474 RepID=A0A1G6GDD0_9ACTN|nr:DNA-formamidopyrimidine glycosylase family protein [Raineyella antarctica]SDB80012.1 formamidopyrimidine-DNA glycosylase [Raineyella antarctica]
MPEAPELDAAAAFLRERGTGRAVTGVEVGDINVLKTPTPVADLVGRRLEQVRRRGKFLQLDFEGLWLVVHLARAGWLSWAEPAPAKPVRMGRGPVSLRVRLEPDAALVLTEAGTRKSAAAYLTPDPDGLPQVAGLGPEAGELDRDRLAAVLAGTTSRVKTVLTDQGVLAGMGNGWSDEVLHRARLSPFATANRLAPEAVTALHQAIAATYAAAAEAMDGVAPDKLKATKKSLYRVHARTGLPCPVCGTDIAEVAFAEKSLQYCPTCQTGGRRLNDRRMDRLLK